MCWRPKDLVKKLLRKYGLRETRVNMWFLDELLGLAPGNWATIEGLYSATAGMLNEDTNPYHVGYPGQWRQEFAEVFADFTKTGLVEVDKRWLEINQDFHKVIRLTEEAALLFWAWERVHKECEKEYEPEGVAAGYDNGDVLVANEISLGDL